jgi:hypothetical protein
MFGPCLARLPSLGTNAGQTHEPSAEATSRREPDGEKSERHHERARGKRTHRPEPHRSNRSQPSPAM